MKVLVSLIITAAVVSSAAGADLKQWQSPDKFYSFLIPAEWEETRPPGEPPSVAFTSPDGKAEIRISAAYGVKLPEKLPDEILDLAFPNEKGITAIARIRGSGWDGLQRDYVDAAQTQRWTGIAARNGSTVILVTMTAPTMAFPEFEKTFKSVSESLKLGK
jgi:hypothetical protein